MTAEPGTLGSKLAGARRQLGWSLRTAERRSGVPNAHISQIETGTIARPEAATLIRLADAYDLPPAELLAMAGRDAELAELQALRDEKGRLEAEIERLRAAASPFLAAAPGTTAYLCSTHRRTVTAGSGEGVLLHTGGNGILECSSARFTVTTRREADRDEVLALLFGAARTQRGGDDEPQVP